MLFDTKATESPMPEHSVIHELSDKHIDQLVDLYAGEWWSVGRQRNDIVRMLAASSLVVGFTEYPTGKLIAFARVLSDFVYKGLIFDVIVAPDQRGKGLGAQLMETVLSHPKLTDVQHFELYCRHEMSAFYERWGFKAALGDLYFLRRSR